jgi:hypothetical protein
LVVIRRASNNTVVMNDDDSSGKRDIMSFLFVVAVCLFVCARLSINKREGREWEMTIERIKNGTWDMGHGRIKM